MTLSTRAPRQCLRSLDVSERQCRHERRPVVVHAVNGRTEIEQGLDECRLQPCLGGMRARDQQIHRRLRVPAAIGVREGVHFGTGTEERCRDGDGIGRRELPEVFDAVRGDVVEQGRAVRPFRSCPNEVKVSTEKCLERCKIAGDDGIGAGLERLRVADESLDVARERAPAPEAVCSSDEELSIGEREPPRCYLTDALFDHRHGAVEARFDEGCSVHSPQTGERLEPFPCPGTNRVGLGRTGDLDEVLGALPVLREIRARWKRQCVHTKLLSVHRLVSARFRLKEGS
jgi:hypothetical protein